MGEPARKVELSWEQYVALEQETGERYEYVDGEVYAMAGGTVEHSDVKVNLVSCFRVALRGKPCRPHDSDYKIRVPATDLGTYPDMSVTCGPPIAESGKPNAATNPTLLAEVLSESTEAWDRGGKFAHYRQLASLQYYLLVNQPEQRVELFTRTPENNWTLTEHVPGQHIPLPLLGIHIAVSELYEDLPEEIEAPA